MENKGTSQFIWDRDQIKNDAAIMGIWFWVQDLERSFKFYTEVIGLKEVMRSKQEYGYPEGFNEIFLSRNGVDGEPFIMITNDAEHSINPIEHGNNIWRIPVAVGSVAAVKERATAAGYEVYGEYRGKVPQIPKHRETIKLSNGAAINDPDGYVLHLFEWECH